MKGIQKGDEIKNKIKKVNSKFQRRRVLAGLASRPEYTGGGTPGMAGVEVEGMTGEEGTDPEITPSYDGTSRTFFMFIAKIRSGVGCPHI